MCYRCCTIVHDLGDTGDLAVWVIRFFFAGALGFGDVVGVR